MKILPDWLKNGYLRLMDPIADWLVRRHVHPNTITIVGTIFMVAGGVLYGTGHIMTGGWLLSITALTDVLDGTVARRSNMSSVFGAFLDSTLDRVADGAVLGGLAVFYALDTLVKLDCDNKILSRDIAAIDLRLPDRVTVQLSDEAAAARAEALKAKSPKKKGGAA